MRSAPALRRRHADRRESVKNQVVSLECLGTHDGLAAKAARRYRDRTARAIVANMTGNSTGFVRRA
jgi:hypothetical protein